MVKCEINTDIISRLFQNNFISHVTTALVLLDLVVSVCFLSFSCRFLYYNLVVVWFKLGFAPLKQSAAKIVPQ